jgi:lysophospholipase L1-like esterase
MTWTRLAVLGDSVAAGTREPHPGYRDLSWIDRVAEALPEPEVLNLARRGLRASEVREHQLADALAFRPDLAIVAAGGNDALHRSFDEEEVAVELDHIVAPLRAAGADVVMIELLDIVASGLIAPDHAPAVSARLSALARVTRAVARLHGAILIRMRTHPASLDPGIYASDRLHLNARGHAIVAAEALRVLALREPTEAGAR